MGVLNGGELVCCGHEGVVCGYGLGLGLGLRLGLGLANPSPKITIQFSHTNPNPNPIPSDSRHHGNRSMRSVEINSPTKYRSHDPRAKTC
eukprot:415608-Amorphochlora_amoeboformis.AAC.1